MITLEKIPDEYCTDHLLLLVGANPLPNYVAARLLTTPESTVHLLHTVATVGFAKAIASLIKEYHPKLKVSYWEMDMVDGANIRQQVKTIIKDLDRTVTIGLHYTGGTKAMAVHAYHTLAEQWPDAIFSYLDAQTLTLRIEYADTSLTRKFPARFACTVSLAELMTLHGYGLKTDLRTTAHQPVIISAIAAICANKTGYTVYRQWQEKAFPREYSEEKATAAVDVIMGNPALAPLAQALATVQSPVTLETFATVAQAKQFRSAATWFNGKWLEEYTLLHLAQVARELEISSYTINLIAKKGGFNIKAAREFELDLAALWGYQLFAFSCRATDQADQAKEHLLEVVIRARQLGGDEAKAALICCSDRPEALEIEVHETWFQGERANRVRVFGRKHLPNLALHLRDWFESANEV